jgi:protein-S-isoprenylcysteine O-methyltransferase Ste14
MKYCISQYIMEYSSQRGNNRRDDFMNTEMKGTFAEAIDRKSLKKTVISRFSLLFIALGAVYFLTAGTFRYWEAWAYMITIFIPMIVFLGYMFRHDPKFLERRMRTREKRKEQKLIVTLGALPILLAFVLPGFDERFGWSDISLSVKIAGIALVLLSYLMILYVFKTNSYAARVVEVEKEQKVITSGPYALVRHPMYVGVIILYIASPVALGSYWALIPALFIIPVIVARIKDEEIELLDSLEGYREYTQKVKHRLLPGIW